MTTYHEQIAALDEETEQVAHAMDAAATMTAEFSRSLGLMKNVLAQSAGDVVTWEKGLRSAFDNVLLHGDSFSDAMRGLGQDIAMAAYDAAIEPVTEQLAQNLSNSLMALISGIFGFADGAPFSQGRVMPFANGGIVSGATPFGMRGGMGIMGEAGPEAIMPLARGPDGKLGVRASGGQSGPTIVMNINTPDAPSFARSQSQIAAQVSRALARANRNR